MCVMQEKVRKLAPNFCSLTSRADKNRPSTMQLGLFLSKLSESDLDFELLW